MDVITQEVKDRIEAKERNFKSLSDLMKGNAKSLKLEFSASDLKNKTLDAKFDVIYELLKKIADKFAQNEADYPQIFLKS